MKKNTLILCCFFALFCSAYAIKPVREYAVTPEMYGLTSETKHLQTADLFNIIAWHIFPASEEKKDISIIISSSDAGNMGNWLEIAGYLALSGFDIWLYDYRGFGESSDFPIDDNMLYYEEFVKDLAIVVETVKNANPQNKICLLGYSLGTLINMKYLIGNQHDVDFCIGDGHVYSPNIVAERLNENSDKVFTLPQTNAPDFNWHNFYENFPIPMMLFHGSEDIVCADEDVKLLKTQVENLTIIPYTGKHLWSYMILQNDYIQHIESFLLKK